MEVQTEYSVCHKRFSCMGFSGKCYILRSYKAVNKIVSSFNKLTRMTLYACMHFASSPSLVTMMFSFPSWATPGCTSSSDLVDPRYPLEARSIQISWFDTVCFSLQKEKNIIDCFVMHLSCRVSQTRQRISHFWLRNI